MSSVLAWSFPFEEIKVRDLLDPLRWLWVFLLLIRFLLSSLNWGLTALVLNWLLHLRRYHHLMLIHDELLSWLAYSSWHDAEILIVNQWSFFAMISDFRDGWNVFRCSCRWCFYHSFRAIWIHNRWHVVHVFDGRSDLLRGNTLPFVEVLLRTIAS